MKNETQKAFQDAAVVAAELAAMPTRIYGIRAEGGVGEQEQLEKLMRLQWDAMKLLRNLGDSVGSALLEFDEQGKKRKEIAQRYSGFDIAS